MMELLVRTPLLHIKDDHILLIILLKYALVYFCINSYRIQSSKSSFLILIHYKYFLHFNYTKNTKYNTFIINKFTTYYQTFQMFLLCWTTSFLVNVLLYLYIHYFISIWMWTVEWIEIQFVLSNHFLFPSILIKINLSPNYLSKELRKCKT